jgi:hypothetical protein
LPLGDEYGLSNGAAESEVGRLVPLPHPSEATPLRTRNDRLYKTRRQPPETRGIRYLTDARTCSATSTTACGGLRGSGSRSRTTYAGGSAGALCAPQCKRVIIREAAYDDMDRKDRPRVADSVVNWISRQRREACCLATMQSWAMPLKWSALPEACAPNGSIRVSPLSGRGS